MKISIDKNVVEFVPESEGETLQLGSLWNLMVDCAKFNKKMVPIGEFIPKSSDLARFMIEGEVDENAPVYAQEDMTVFCQTCNKYFKVKKGAQVPLCCGRVMEPIE